MDLAELIEAARLASQNAYAPYSKFRVGATILTGEGVLYTGCNVENASYGLSICAERNATANMILHEPDGHQIKLVAVVSPGAAPCFPCGACRQVLREFGCEEVVVEDRNGNILTYPFEEILPNSFGPEHL